MRLGPLGLPELLLILFNLALIVGAVWFVIWAVTSHLRNQQNIREVLERIAEGLESKP